MKKPGFDAFGLEKVTFSVTFFKNNLDIPEGVCYNP
jgi:hypothetical protein